MRDEIGRFAEHGVKPLGINPAPAGKHADYARRLGLPFPLLSDPGLEAARLYGAVNPGGASVSRTVVLVEQGGIVRFAQSGAPGADLVLDALEEA